MAVISNDTFNALRRYVSVRLQQGVPIVDADWNEMQDIQSYELRAFLKWFVGDGVPANNNGFQVEGTGADSDFIIRAGGGASGINAGRCLVDGLDIFITTDVNYTDQPLHADQPDAAELATAWEVPEVPRIEDVLPGGSAGDLTVYLDVWHRLVTPEEDPTLVHTGLGVESCARLRREWVVRVRAGDGVPTTGDPDFLANHHYYQLALIGRGTALAIAAGNVTDRRHRGLTVVSLVDRLARLEARILLPGFDDPPFTPVVGRAGDAITIFGRNFDVGTPRVVFGTTDGTVSTFTEAEITAVVPTLPTGAVEITVVTDGGSATAPINFNVLPGTGGGPPPPPTGTPPTISTVNPVVGRSGDNITISGTNLSGASVSFDGVAATVTSSSATSLIAIVPAGLSVGPHELRVSNGDGDATTTFTILP